MVIVMNSDEFENQMLQDAWQDVKSMMLAVGVMVVGSVAIIILIHGA